MRADQPSLCTSPSHAGKGVVTQQLSSSLDLLSLHRLNPERYPFLLESVASHVAQARYDILFAFPGATLRLDASGLTAPFDCPDNDFLTALDAWWQATAADAHVVSGADVGDKTDKDLPFRGGWFVYLGYELAGQIEPVLNLPEDHSSSLPIACAVRIPAAIIRDHQTGCCYLVSEQPHMGPQELIDLMVQDIKRAGEQAPTSEPGTPAVRIDEDAADRYLDSVDKIRDYIRDGDVFQVNLSRQWQADPIASLTAADLYQRLRTANPSPFAALAKLGRSAIISSSPERLVSVRDRVVETRPIAGTRPRSSEQVLDSDLSAELLSHPKERAEHIMLIDLERNDLGRVCQPGSVEVDELMVLESYAHVHHIVSNVRGLLQENTTPGEVIRAVFPGGTITGCPKVRCMEIVAELEQTGRGAYTGSLGYLNLNGDMDMNILIRTLVMERDKIIFRAGAGVVADSDPVAELEETRTKAKGLRMALGV